MYWGYKMRLIYAYITGLIFGLGISIAGMGNPAKVLNFFDIAGTWDPSLAFVMGGAMLTAMIGYRFVFKKNHPLLDSVFHLPTKQDLDASLIGGSIVFGMGWGIAGFCPGGALPMLSTGQSEVFIFVASLIAGIYAAKWMQARRFMQSVKA